MERGTNKRYKETNGHTSMASWECSALCVRGTSWTRPLMSSAVLFWISWPGFPGFWWCENAISEVKFDQNHP